MAFNIIDILLTAGAIQGFFLALILGTRKSSLLPSHRVLAILIFILSLCTAAYSLSGLFGNREQIGMFLAGPLFLMGPFLWKFSHYLFSPEARLELKDSIHFIPFLVYCVLLIIIRNMNIDPFNSLFHPLAGISIFLQTLPYIIIILVSLKKRNDILKESFSSLEKRDYRWVFSVVTGYMILWGIAGISELSNELLGWHGELWTLIWSISTVCVYVLGYFALVKEHSAGEFQKQTNEVLARPGKKYSKTSLTKKTLDEYNRKLDACINNKKPHLQPGLTLADLAKMLSISPHNLSQLLNETRNMSFFNFINDLRVEEAMNMLKSPDGKNLLIAAVAMDSGFSSLSSFNKAFKTKTGMRPKEFR